MAIINKVKLPNNSVFDICDSTARTNISELENLLKNTGKIHVCDGERKYVDGVNGNDDNDGTQGKPWKTMDRFFKEANKTIGGKIDIRCYIVSAGTYVIGENGEHTFNGITIHITGVTGVILKFKTSEDVKFYNSHVNIAQCSIDASSAIEFALDGSTSAFTNVTFNVPVHVYGGSAVFNTCSCKKFSLQNSIVTLNAITITNTSNNENAYDINTCFVRFAGSAQNENLSANGTSNAFVNAVASFILFGITFRNTTNKYYYGFKGDGCVVKLLNTAYNNFVSRSVAGIADTTFGTLFITEGNKVLS